MLFLGRKKYKPHHNLASHQSTFQIVIFAGFVQFSHFLHKLYKIALTHELVDSSKHKADHYHFISIIALAIIELIVFNKILAWLVMNLKQLFGIGFSTIAIVLAGSFYLYNRGVICADVWRAKTDPVTLQTIDSTLLQEISKILSAYFGGTIQPTSIVQLSEPWRRNLVLRIAFQVPNKDAHLSAIVKQSLRRTSDQDDQAAFGRFARDWAGLEFVSSLKTDTLLAPRFYGGNTKYRFIIVEDLGQEHISLVNYLTARDIQAATTALRQFMIDLAQLHGYSHKKTVDYQQILQRIYAGTEPEQDPVVVKRSDIIERLDAVLQRLEIPLTANAKQEAEEILRAVTVPGPFLTLIHGDCCPDNTFVDQSNNRLLLIDFEGCYIRNALLDATYLRMSMPTCWCAKMIPATIIASLEMVYRHELIKKIPEASNDAVYFKAYDNACAYWMIAAVLSIEKFWVKDEPRTPGPLPKGAIWDSTKDLGRPRVISRIQAFIAAAKQHGNLIHLQSMAEQILQKLHVIWPDAQPLDLFAAFSDAQ